MAEANIFCPKCNILLTPLSYKGVTIDKCPNCNGVWLDKGEESFVTEILRRLSNNSCDNCIHLIDRKKCGLLNIIVTRDFHCSHHVSA